MSECNDRLDEQNLLEQIEIVLPGQTLDDRSRLAELAAFIAQAIPAANTDFRKQLEVHLLNEWEQHMRSQRLNTSKVEQIRFYFQTLKSRTRKALKIRQRLLPHYVTRTGMAILIAFLVLLVSPNARHMTAQALERMERTFMRVTGQATGLTGLQPLPPFAVKQPASLPEGIELAATLYYLGADFAQSDVRGESMLLDSETMLPDPIIQSTIRQNRGNAPYLVLVYKSDQPHYIILFQRASKDRERLPSGATRTVRDLPAVLQENTPMRRLIWIADGTWTELESTLSEAELLHIAENMVALDETTVARVFQLQSASHDMLSQIGQRKYCDSSQQLPKGPMLGDVKGQQYLGSVAIEMLSRDSRRWEHTSIGTNVPKLRTQVLERALATLSNAATSMQKLDYPAVVTSYYDEAAQCHRPADVEGYIVIEVWSNQVNVGFGAKGFALKDRAIEELKRALQR